MTKKIRWGIISTAHIGETQVIPAIQQSYNGEVVAVGSRDLDKGKAFAARLNIPKVYGSYEELLADPEIDAIYNPLPNAMHAEWSVKAAEAGKHVLCEKPLASNADEARMMVTEFGTHGKLLAEAFMYRFHPQTQKVKEMVNDGAVGKIHFITATFNFAINSETNIRLNSELAGGALMDVGCYCVNIIRYLLGEEPVEVKAIADFGAGSKVDERLAGLMLFPSGAITHFDCSLRTQFTNTYEIRGSTGRIVVEKAFVPFRPDPNLPIIIRHWDAASGYQEIEIERPNQYTLMAEDFADAILNHRPPRYPIEDSVKTMALIDRLYATARG